MKNRIYLEFSVTPSTTFQTVSAGAAANFPVAVAPLGGFSNTVNLTVSGLPSGASGGFSPASVNLATINATSTNSTLSISTSVSTPPGTYPLSIVGTSGGVSHTNTVGLVVGLFGITATPASQTVAPGGNGAFTVNLVTNTGFSGAVSLGLSALPANTSAGFSPGSLSGAGSSTLTITTTGSTAPGTYPLTIYGTNGGTVASATVSLVVGLGNPTWNGGSASDSNWSDAANWGGASVAAGAPLAFGGNTRLNNNNDTTAGASYASLVFDPGAGAFVLGGNPIILGGSITNYSSNPQTINLGLSFGTSLTLSGAGNTLVIGNGLTNTLGASGSTTLTLTGAGIITNLLRSTASPGGTNIIALNDPNGNWTLEDNATSAGMTVPWVFSVNNGTFNYGTAGSSPTLTLTTPDNMPQDNLVGNVSGAVGTFNMINGVLTTGSRFNTANASSSTGIINQTGGTWNMGVQFQGANGSNPGEVSVVNLSGGTMNIGAGGGQFYVASRGTGTLTMSGAAVLNCGTLDVSRNANGTAVGSVGTVNLNGGTILASKVGTATANTKTGAPVPSATFNFNGGTLKINSSTAPFFQGSTVAPVIPILAKVQGGGAIMDTNGKTNVFAEPLLHDGIVDPDPDGGLTKNGAGTLVLASNVTYNGNTTINAGSLALTNSVGLGTSPVLTVGAGATLDASGRTDQTLTLVNGQTLEGSGAVLGSLVVVGGSVVSPGSAGSVGVLTVGNNATLNGTTVMKLNRSGPTNDVLQVGGALGGSGTLMLTNIGGTLAPGDSFQLFNASSYSVAFTNIVPAMPGSGLAWDVSNLSGSGKIAVVKAASPQISHFGVSGGLLSLSGSGGPPRANYYVLASTNAALPLSQWTFVATNSFDTSGNFQWATSLDPNAPSGFYLLRLP
jgi:autotransporter-associated beta strand protein